MSYLRLEGVSKAWGDSVGLASLDLEVEAGELVTVVGPSGSGKSTALRVVAGLERPDEGRVLIDGRDVSGVPASERGVAMVFQSFALFPHLSVERNIGFGLSARGTEPAETRRLVAETADWLGLSELLPRRPAELSGGERQRVALARALVRRPRVLLLDEPLSNLDAQLRVQTRAEIRRLHDEAGTTTVYVTHDQAEALSLGSRAAVLREGRLQQFGPPDTVYERPANSFVASFLGNPPMNLLPARCEGGEVRVNGVGLARADASDGRDVLLGFRPERVVLGGRSGAEARLELAEQAGHDRVWHLSVAGCRVTARPPAGFDVREGAALTVAIEPGGVRLFDSETGAAL